MRVLSFALTGFGNKVLDALLAESCEIVAVITRKEDSLYPYYPEENITKYASQKGLKVYEDFSWSDIEEIIKESKPDLLLAATFHKIIPPRILPLASNCVNLHPSLLPKYRGATPIAWCLYNKESITGVTAHLLTDEADKGDMLIQKKIKIKKNDNESMLRKKLSLLAAEVAKDLINQINTKSLNPTPQNEEDATYYPNFNISRHAKK